MVISISELDMVARSIFDLTQGSSLKDAEFEEEKFE